MAESALFDTWYSWVGQQVCVKGNLKGILRYVGETEFGGGIWCGVELDEPLGENDGMINNVRYFKCGTNHGIFVSQLETSKVYTEINKNISEAHFQENVFQTANVALNKTFDICVTDAPGKRLSSSKDKLAEDTINVNPLYAGEKLKKVLKRSEDKRFPVLSSQESLGILSYLIEDDSLSFPLFNPKFSKENDMVNSISVESEKNESLDSVFLPPSSTNKIEVLQNCMRNEITFTSTPKHSINTLTLQTIGIFEDDKLDISQDEHSLMQVLHSDSAEMNYETDFKVCLLHNSRVLTSTSKALSVLLEQSTTIENESSYKNIVEPLELESNLNKTQVLCANKGHLASTNKSFQNKKLNTTFEVDNSSLRQYNIPILALNPNIESNDVADNLNSTFVVRSDMHIDDSKCEDTSTLNCSPVKIMKPELSKFLKKETQFKDVTSKNALTNTATKKILKDSKSSVKTLSNVDSHPQTTVSPPKKWRNSIGCFPCKPICVPKSTNKNMGVFQNHSTFRTNKSQVNNVPQNFNKRYSLATVPSAIKQTTYKSIPGFKKPLTVSSKIGVNKSIPKVQTLGGVKKSQFSGSNSVPSEKAGRMLKECLTDPTILKAISYSIKKNGKCMEKILDSSIRCNRVSPAKENIPKKISRISQQFNFKMNPSRSNVHNMEHIVELKNLNEFAINKQSFSNLDTIKAEKNFTKGKVGALQSSVLSKVSHIGKVNNRACKPLKVNYLQNAKTLLHEVDSKQTDKASVSNAIIKPRNLPGATTVGITKHSNFQNASNDTVSLDDELSKVLTLDIPKKLPARPSGVPKVQVTMTSQKYVTSSISKSSVSSKVIIQGGNKVPAVQNGIKEGRSLLPTPVKVRKSVMLSNVARPQAQQLSAMSEDCPGISRKIPVKKLQSPRAYRIRS